MLEVQNGDIIRFKNDNVRDWVALHYTCGELRRREKFNKNVKDNTGYYLFGGLWYEGNALTDKPYGKCMGILKRGMFADIEIVGNISNRDDYLQYKKCEKILK